MSILLTTWRLRTDLAAPHAHLLVRHVVAAPHGHADRAALLVPLRVPRTVSLPSLLPIAGAPSLAAPLADGILAAYHSPLHGQGAQLVALSRQYRIDDAVALGFFVMESRAGTVGEALATHNVGNLRPMPDAAVLDGYSSYASWMDGTVAWFRVLRSFYLDTLKLSTVETLVPVYAPVWDSNDPSSMIAGIRQLVGCWRGDTASCPDDPPGVPALVTRAWQMHVVPPRPPIVAQRSPRLMRHLHP
ncbi:MAG TPA: hypothetical protein VHB98_19700 [Chloroflexota bacterium]|nr:hypothetical protein [Chloroflexota bacterium]